MTNTLARLRSEHEALLIAAEEKMAEATREGDATAERRNELFDQATAHVEEAEDMESRIKTAERALRMRERADELERASAPRPAVSGPATTRSAIADMTEDEIATRNRLVNERLAFHERSFTDEEQSLVNRMPMSEQVSALRLVGENAPGTPAHTAWRKLAARATGGEAAYNPAQSITADANIIPVSWFSSIVSEKKDDGSLFSNSAVNLVTKPSESGTFTIAYESDTKDWELVPIAEATPADTQKGDFINKTINVSKYYRRSALSWELTQDSPFMVRSFLTEKIGDAVARGASKLFLNGGQQVKGIIATVPNGGLAPARLGVTAAASGFPTIKELLDVVGHVDETYLMTPRTRWLMHRKMMIALRKETTTDLRMWSDADYRAGLPAMLHGFPVVYNADLPSTASATNKVALFGDFGCYWALVDGTPRMMSEYVSGTDQYVITLYIRLGGSLIDQNGLAYALGKN